MAIKFNQFQSKIDEIYTPRAEDEKRFAAKHVVAVTKDAAGNDPDFATKGMAGKKKRLADTDDEEQKKVYEYNYSYPVPNQIAYENDDEPEDEDEGEDEEENESEDYEGEMAKAELRAVATKAGALAQMMDDEMELEAWLQSKISVAKKDIDAVYDYVVFSMMPRMNSEQVEAALEMISEEALDEVLKKSDSAGKWISDFVHSDNPKFKGKSKKQRMKQALAAYYAKQRNEEVDKQYIEVVSKTGAKRHVEVHPSKAYDALNKYKKAGNKARIVNKPAMKEETELEEANKGPWQFKVTTKKHGEHTVSVPAHKASSQADAEKVIRSHPMYAKNKPTKINAKQQNEEVELEEGMVDAYAHERKDDSRKLQDWSKSKLDRFRKIPHGSYSRKEIEDEHKRRIRSSEYEMRSKESVKEEVELDEARRGRPRKDGSSSDEEGGREHIVMQLRKAVNLRGQKHVEFNSGEKHQVSVDHAKKALDMHDSMKKAEDKQEFAGRLAKSHGSFKDAISGKPGEPKKPKITLAKFAGKK